MCGLKLLKWMFPLISILIMVTQVEASRAKFTITDLGKNLTPTAINNRGEVVGFITTTTGQRHAFLYSNGKLSDLGTFSGTDSEAHNINNRGRIVGQYTIYGQKHAFLLHNRHLTDLFTAAAMIDAVGINDDDVILGQVSHAGPTMQLQHAILYKDGLITDIHQLGKEQGVIYPLAGAYGKAINVLEQVVFDHRLCPAADCEQSFLYHAGTFTRIPLFAAVDINDKGQATGTGGFVFTRGYIYEAGKLVLINDFGGQRTFPKAINNLGQVVGNALTAPTLTAPTVLRAFIYSNAIMTDLNTLLPNTRLTLSDATDINDRGQIIGTGLLRGEAHAFVLTPSVQRVEIDIKPKDASNRVNLHPHEQLPVVIFGSSVFDASSIRPASVRLTETGVYLKGRGDRYLYSISDVNGDGFKDFVATIYIEQMAITSGPATLTLTLEATTSNGQEIVGEESVRQVSHGKWFKHWQRHD